MSSISYSELKKGARIVLNGQPYEIIEASSMFKGRGHSVSQTKLKNLITGEIISRTLHPSDSFEEAEISKIKAKFIYSHPIRKSSISNGAGQDKFIFSKEDNPSERFDLTEEQIGSAAKFLKSGQIVEGLFFGNKIINISLPIKIRLKVKEAPPEVKGNRAQSGSKTVILETGTEINVPLFIQEDDVIEINTEKAEYVRRIEKR